VPLVPFAVLGVCPAYPRAGSASQVPWYGLARYLGTGWLWGDPPRGCGEMPHKGRRCAVCQLRLRFASCVCGLPVRFAVCQLRLRFASSESIPLYGLTPPERAIRWVASGGSRGKDARSAHRLNSCVPLLHSVQSFVRTTEERTPAAGVAISRPRCRPLELQELGAKRIGPHPETLPRIELQVSGLRDRMASALATR
jgi:hypothetical protein